MRKIYLLALLTVSILFTSCGTSVTVWDDTYPIYASTSYYYGTRWHSHYIPPRRYVRPTPPPPPPTRHVKAPTRVKGHAPKQSPRQGARLGGRR